MNQWEERYANRWRAHVSDEEAEYVDLILAEVDARPSELILAKLIIRLGCEVDDAEEARWADAMGDDL